MKICIEQDKAGLYYATSPQVPGLLVAKRTLEEVEADLPRAIGEIIALAGLRKFFRSQK